MKLRSWVVFMFAALLLIFSACAPTEVTPAAEEVPETGEEGVGTPAVGETPLSQETPLIGETPMAEESPLVEETPLTGETPAVDDTPAAGAGAETAVCPTDLDPQEVVTAGQTVYQDQCAGCHGQQGEGSGDFPALVGNERLASGDIVGLVQGYLSVEAHPELNSEDMAAVLTFANNTFSQEDLLLCAEQIDAVPAAP